MNVKDKPLYVAVSSVSSMCILKGMLLPWSVISLPPFLIPYLGIHCFPPLEWFGLPCSLSNICDFHRLHRRSVSRICLPRGQSFWSQVFKALMKRKQSLVRVHRKHFMTTFDLKKSLSTVSPSPPQQRGSQTPVSSQISHRLCLSYVLILSTLIPVSWAHKHHISELSHLVR